MKDIALHAKWLIKAPLTEVFNVMTDFEKFPEYFPKVGTFRIMKALNLELPAWLRKNSFHDNIIIR